MLFGLIRTLFRCCSPAKKVKVWVTSSSIEMVYKSPLEMGIKELNKEQKRRIQKWINNIPEMDGEQEDDDLYFPEVQDYEVIVQNCDNDIVDNESIGSSDQEDDICDPGFEYVGSAPTMADSC